VIPSLNEAENISGALASLRGEAGLFETVVVDGGSSDGTRALARSLGARVIGGERGRGLQINTGVRQCRGDVILILHADCRIRTGALKRILTTLNDHPRCLGGAMGMRYDPTSFRNRILAWANNDRARWTGISFGDQGQFFRKEALALIGGYPDQMLMGDIELSMRIRERGLSCFMPDGIVVSQRRWEKMGFLKNCKRVLTLSSSYLIARRLKTGDPKRRDFYDRYYNS
jgi:glycosyltransferase involved in cell wall biosynthesis